MKKLLIFSLLLTGAYSCMAQRTAAELLPANANPKVREFHEWANGFISAMDQATAARTTTTGERVVAESKYVPQGGWTLHDSTRFFYTGSNGSVYNFNTLDHHFQYYIMSGFPFYFIVDEYKPEVEMDSITYYDAANGSSVPDRKVKVVYDADGDILDYRMEWYLGGALDNGDHFINTYNAQGKLRQSLLLMYNGTQWDSTNRKLFSYNSQGLLISDTLFEYDNGWVPGYRERITYNASNKVTKVERDIWSQPDAAWTDTQGYLVSYYSNGKAKDLTIGIYSGPVFLAAYKDSLGYAPGCDFFNARQISTTMTTLALEPVIRYSRHLNAQNLPDTAITQANNGSTWTMEEKDLLFYNANNSPIRKIVRNNGDTAVRIENYYYEQYNIPSSVPAVAHAENMRIYPNPAGSLLHIEWNDAVQNQPVTITLSNLTGQKVYNEQRRWKGQSQQVSTASLTPGLYLLSVTDAQGRPLYRQKVVKQ